MTRGEAITAIYALFNAPHNADINIVGLNKVLDDLCKASKQDCVGYWMGEFNDGVATLYEVPQESLFGRAYKNIPVYTTPPQRTWVGLTDEEIDKAWRSVDYTIPYAQFRIDVAKAIEAKLKEKNHDY
jgi:hypothetical protein